MSQLNLVHKEKYKCIIKQNLTLDYHSKIRLKVGIVSHVALECGVPLTLLSPNLWSAGTVPQLRRRLPAAAVATSGAARSRPTRELSTLRVRDHCWPAEGQQTLELQQGIAVPHLARHICHWREEVI